MSSAAELVIPQREALESQTDFFTRVVRRTLADYGDLAIPSISGTKHIEAGHFSKIGDETATGQFYTSFDAATGIETIGITLHHHTVARPHGFGYEALAATHQKRAFTITMRNYFLRDGAVLERYDHIGRNLLTRSIIDQPDEVADEQLQAVGSELEADFDGLRQGWQAVIGDASNSVLIRAEL